MRRTRFKLLFVLSLIMAMACPALSQKTGTRLDRNSNAPASVNDAGVNSAILVANGFGQCLARREGKRMRVVLDLPLLAPEQVKGLIRSIETFDGCLGDSDEFDQLRSHNILMIGGAAEYFVGTALKKTDLSSLTGMTDELLMKTDFRPRTVLEDLGLCIVRRDVAKSKALLASMPTSDAEKMAVKAITPEIGPCVSAGAELKLNAPNIRALIAYALYRAASKLDAKNA